MTTRELSLQSSNGETLWGPSVTRAAPWPLRPTRAALLAAGTAAPG